MVNQSLFVGYSRLQRELISGINSGLDSANSVFNDITNEIENTVDSLNVVDSVFYSDIVSVDLNNLNVQNDKINIDEEHISNIADFVSLNTDNFNSLISVDDEIFDKINSLDSDFNVLVVNNNEVNTTFVSDLESLVSLFDETKAAHLEVNAELNSIHDEHQSTFDASKNSLIDSDNSTISVLNGLNSDLQYSIESLRNLDSKFRVEDKANSDAIKELTTAIMSNFSIFEDENNSLNSLAEFNKSLMDETFESITNSSNELVAYLNTIISDFNIDVSDFNTQNQTLASLIVENKFEFDSTLVSLTSLNSEFGVNLDNQMSIFNSDINSINDVNDAILEEITSDYSIFNQTVLSLNSNRDLAQVRVNEIAASLVEIANSKFENNGLTQQNIDNDFTDINSTIASLQSLDSSFQVQVTQFDNSLHNQTDSVYEVNSLQNFRINEISDDVTSINDDITSRIDVEINLKLTDSHFDEITQSLLDENTYINEQLLLQVTATAQSTLDSTQWSMINTKTPNSLYDSQMTLYDNKNDESDIRMRTMEEFFRLSAETYRIKNDSTSIDYKYTGSFQNVEYSNLPPIFYISGKKQISATKWAFVIKFTNYGFNTFLNRVEISPNTSGAFDIISFEKDDININNAVLDYTFAIENSRSGNSFIGNGIPFNISYKNMDDTNLYFVEINQQNFATLPDLTPPGVSYPATSFSFPIGTEITPISPTPDAVCGVNLAYELDVSSSALPLGLSLNEETGVISGTPVEVKSTTTYVIRIYNDYGAMTQNVSIDTGLPPNVSYSGIYNFPVGEAIVPIAPTDAGAGITYTVYSGGAALPDGLTLNSTTGVISGTPTTTRAAAVTTIKATNNYGDDIVGNSITIAVGTKPVVSYNGTYKLAIGTISTINPSSNNNAAGSEYSISPALPSGLNLNTTNGVISGVPSVVSSITSYTITVTNSFGTDNAGNTISIVTGYAPTFTYVTPQSYTTGTAITALTPTITQGGDGIEFSVAPALPNGLTINTSTGVITGTPNVAGDAVYTITATNTITSSTFSLTINIATASGGSGDGGSGTQITQGDLAYGIGDLFTLGDAGIAEGTNSNVNAIAVIGDDVYLGGNFTSANGVPNTAYIAKYNKITKVWSALGTGTNGLVLAITAIGTNLYVGGNFTLANNVPNTAYIAKYDTVALSWSALGTGTNGIVYAMAAVGNNLYIGGNFTVVNGVTNAAYIAKYNTIALSWSTLGTGTNGAVNVISAIGTDLYVGGTFLSANGVANTAYIAKYNTDGWSALGTGTNGTVNAITAVGPDLYIGGQFNLANGVTNTAYIAKYNTDGWSAVGTGTNSFVNTIAAIGTDLYVGGLFSVVNGVLNTAYIAKYNTSEGWSALGTGTNNTVNTITAVENNLYIGGDFTTIFGANRDRIAVIDTTNVTLSSLFSRTSDFYKITDGVNNTVRAIAVIEDDVYVGGTFTSVNNVPNTAYIAKYNKTTKVWSALGNGTNNIVFAITAVGTNLYVGGAFTSVNGVDNTFYIAKYNTDGWSALGTGTNNTVNTITAVGNNLYIGGNFTVVNGVTNAAYIAKYNTDGWSALGTGTNGNVSAITAIGTDLYVGGLFTLAAGIPYTAYIAKYNTDVWSAVGTGTNGAVNSITAIGNDLYVGGLFTLASGVTNTNRIAKYDMSNGAWSALGTGTNGTVNAITAVGPDLYVGGGFTTVNGVAGRNRIAKYNTSTGAWSALGTGTASVVNTITAVGNDLYIGGDFTAIFGANRDRIALIKLPTAVNTRGTKDYIVNLWGRYISGTSADQALSVATDSVGNVYMTGYCSAALTEASVGGTMIGTYSTLIDGFVIKYSKTGTFKWGRYIGGTGNDRVTNIVTSSDGIYISGFCAAALTNLGGTMDNSYAGGTTSDGYIIKYDIEGVFKWGRYINAGDSTTFAETALGITTDSSGNVYVTGSCSTAIVPVPIGGTMLNNFTTGSSASDGFILKYASDGVFIWGRYIGGTGTDQALDVTTDSSGNVYITGFCSGTLALTNIGGTMMNNLGAGVYDGFILKYSSTGGFVWGRYISGTLVEQSLGVATDSSGNVYVTGYCAAALTSLGNGKNMIGSYVSNEDGFIIKLSSDSGIFLWGRYINGITSLADRANSITVDSDDNVYITGYCGGTFDIDLNLMINNYHGNEDGILLKLGGANGSIHWGRYIIGNATNTAERGLNVVAYSDSDSEKGVYIVGYCNSDLVNDRSVMINSYSTSQDGFILKICNTGQLYSGDYNYNINNAIANISPVITISRPVDKVGTFTTAPTLPSGISIDRFGIISGTPVQSAALTTYAINDPNIYCIGENKNKITIYVDGAPSINYGTNLITFTAGTAASVRPTNLGGNATYSISPALPSGISINTSTGVITANSSTVISASTSYTVTATNTFGTVTATFNIVAVNKLATNTHPTDFLWGRYINVTDVDVATFTTTDSVGNVYVAGYCSGALLEAFIGGTMTGTYSGSSNDGYIIKYSSLGTFVWGRYITNSLTTVNDRVLGIKTDSDGNVYITGFCTAALAFQNIGGVMINSYEGGQDGFIIKYSSTGNFVWGRYINSLTVSEQTLGVATDSSGNVYISGLCASHLTPTSIGGSMIGTYTGGQDGIILKYSSTGSFIWGRYIGGTGIVGDSTNGIVTDFNDNVYVTGFCNAALTPTSVGGSMIGTYIGGNDGFILKYSNTGSFVWGRYIGGTNNTINEQGLCVAIDSIGDVYVAGYCGSELVVASIGGTMVGTFTGGQDGFILKYSNSGVFGWGRYIASTTTSSDQVLGVATDSNNNVYIVGYCAAALTNASIGGTMSNAYTGSQDGFIIKYSSTGTFAFGKYIAGATTSGDQVLGLSVDSANNIYITGFCNSALTTASIGGTMTGTYLGGNDGFIIKYGKL